MKVYDNITFEEGVRTDEDIQYHEDLLRAMYGEDIIFIPQWKRDVFTKGYYEVANA